MALTRFTPVRVSPWRDVGDLSHSIGRLFGETVVGGVWTPPVSVEENADQLVFTIEVPGVAKDAISVEVKNETLTISGAKKEEREEGSEGSKYHVWERHSGSFQRTFKLPRTVNVDDVHADCRDGLLIVRVQKLAEAKPRQIEISTGD